VTTLASDMRGRTDRHVILSAAGALLLAVVGAVLMHAKF